MTEEPKKKRKKRKKGVSPTARSLAECRKRGWIVQVVERVVPHSFIKQDLFGCIDIVAITPAGIMGIQATANSSGHHADHRAKILAEPRIKRWLEAGASFELWSWAKQGAAGKRKLWTLRVESFSPGDFPALEAAA